MKKLFLFLLATMLLVPQTYVRAEDNTVEVCKLILNEDGEPINEEEYQKCLEENGYGVEPTQGKWGDPNA